MGSTPHTVAPEISTQLTLKQLFGVTGWTCNRLCSPHRFDTSFPCNALRAHFSSTFLKSNYPCCSRNVRNFQTLDFLGFFCTSTLKMLDSQVSGTPNPNSRAFLKEQPFVQSDANDRVGASRARFIRKLQLLKGRNTFFREIFCVEDFLWAFLPVWVPCTVQIQ